MVKKAKKITEEQIKYAVIGLFVVLISLIIVATQLDLSALLPESIREIITTTTGEERENETVDDTNRYVTEFCDGDEVCDPGENADICPHDCIESTALSAARSAETPNFDETSPIVTIVMQDPEGVQDCGVSPDDALQWDCTVKSPGEIVTDVDCQLQNYELDGKYRLVLRCTDTTGDKMEPVALDDIIICADPLGCKR